MPQRSDDYNYVSKFVSQEQRRVSHRAIVVVTAIMLAAIILLVIVGDVYALPMPQRHG